jgi:hypothetical protein
MMVHERHISVYDKYSVLILVMATDVPSIRTLISASASGTCLLILPNSVPGCCCDWYMLAHPALLFFRLHPAGPPECGTFVAPERHARSKTRQSFIQVLQGGTLPSGTELPADATPPAGVRGRPRRRRPRRPRRELAFQSRAISPL